MGRGFNTKNTNVNKWGRTHCVWSGEARDGELVEGDLCGGVGKVDSTV